MDEHHVQHEPALSTSIDVGSVPPQTQYFCFIEDTQHHNQLKRAMFAQLDFPTDGKMSLFTKIGDQMAALEFTPENYRRLSSSPIEIHNYMLSCDAAFVARVFALNNEEIRTYLRRFGIVVLHEVGRRCNVVEDEEEHSDGFVIDTTQSEDNSTSTSTSTSTSPSSDKESGASSPVVPDWLLAPANGIAYRDEHSSEEEDDSDKEFQERNVASNTSAVAVSCANVTHTPDSPPDSNSTGHGGVVGSNSPNPIAAPVSDSEEEKDAKEPRYELEEHLKSHELATSVKVVVGCEGDNFRLPEAQIRACLVSLNDPLRMVDAMSSEHRTLKRAYSLTQ